MLMIQENKGNVLNQFTNFNKVDEFPKSLLISGRHCMLGIEGSRKSYLVLDMMIKLSNEERGIPTICSFNTIEQQYEKYETAISIAESLGWKEGKIRNKIRLLPSTREITRNLFKTKMPWFSEIMRTKSKGNERLDLLSIHQKTWKVTKPCATHPKHFGYNYQQDNMNNNLLTACNFIMGRLKQTKNHVKQHTLAIVSKNGDAPDKNKIQEFMDDCIHSLNEPWRHPEIKVKQKNLLEAITNKINRTGKYLDADKNFEVCIFTKDDINNTKDILKENNILINYIRNSFDDDSESIILFTQHEKFTWEFNPVMFPTTRIDWAINNFRIFQDETPITKFSTLNMETLGNHSLSRAFYKNKENLTAHEYNMLKMLDPDTLIKVKTTSNCRCRFPSSTTTIQNEKNKT